MTGTEGESVQFFSCSISALRWQWAINVTPRPLCSRKTNKVPILEEAGLSPGPAWANMEIRKCITTTGDLRTPDRPARCGSLDRLRYMFEIFNKTFVQLHLLGCEVVSFGRWVCFLTRNCLQQIFPKLRKLPAKLRNVIPHKTVILTLTTVKISNLIF